MPTLSVTVVDKIKDKVINEEYPNILLDDSIKVIKQKIFAYHPEFIPNNLKLEYKNNNDEFVIINDSASILYEYFEKLPEDPVIYITDLQHELKNYDLTLLYTKSII